MNLISIVHDLRKAKGRNDKIRILKEHFDNTMWKQFLLYTYDTSITYGVSPPKDINYDVTEIYPTMFESFDLLQQREVTGNDAKNYVKGQTQLYGEIPALVLGRSIKAGVSVTTINKVYPNLIPVFESMKGMDVPIEKYPIFSSTKYDGVKVFAEVDPWKVVLLTSSGAKFPLDSLTKELQRLPPGMYEGELIHKEGKQVHRSVISGQLNSLLAGTITDISDYSFMIYDNMKLGEWANKYPKRTFLQRQSLLSTNYSKIFNTAIHTKLVTHFRGDSEEEIVSYFETKIAQGYEGSMHRYGQDFYEWKRTPRLIKKKSIKECVLTCVGVHPHSNPLKGNIGSLICEGGIVDKELGNIPVHVKVGSGLSKFDINKEPEEYIGKSIEVLYNTVTRAGNGYSLFLPRFKRVVKSIA